MGDVLSVKVEGVDEEVKRLVSILSPSSRRDMTLQIGYAVQERTADHIARASVTRHKTADSLGAPHSGFLEFAPGRVRSEARFANGDGTRPTIEARDAAADSVCVVISNTPGLSRALHALTITPKRAKALTIPINAISYAKSVRDNEREGWKIHRQGRVLMGKRGTQSEALWVLCGKVTIPQDRGLLPLESEISDWAADTVDAFVELNAE